MAVNGINPWSMAAYQAVAAVEDELAARTSAQASQTEDQTRVMYPKTGKINFASRSNDSATAPQAPDMNAGVMMQMMIFAMMQMVSSLLGQLLNAGQNGELSLEDDMISDADSRNQQNRQQQQQQQQEQQAFDVFA